MKPWLIKKIKSVALVLLPYPSRRRDMTIGLAKKVLSYLRREFTYNKWLAIEAQAFNKKKAIKNGPLISILVPCYNTPDKYITPLIESVVNQTYTNWELCVADGSTDSKTALNIKTLCDQDKRIKYTKIKDNLGISGNTNIALRQAKGKFVALLDHDDILSEHALSEVASVIKAKDDVDFIYSDEDKLSDDGKKRQTPFFKPGWSPDLLLGVNYITHFSVIRTSLMRKIGGLRTAYDGAQDYDLFLRITEVTDKIFHIPKVLYHWRLADGSTAKVVGEKRYADTAGQRALADAVKRRKIKAEVVEIPERPTNYRLRYKIMNNPLVSVVIPFKDKPDLLRTCVNSILDKSSYANYELILVSNNSTEPETYELLNEYKKHKKCKVFQWDNPFNYSAVNNYGISKSKGEYLILLNNDTEVISPEWIEELVGVATQDGVGAVGPLLYYPDDTIQHAGIVLGMNTMAGHPFRGRLKDEWTHFGLTTWPRNFLAVTGACLAIKRERYIQAGGLDENFVVAGNDVALGIKLHENGYRNIYWPFAQLYHYENASVGSYSNVPISDYNLSLKYYGPYLHYKDPYFNDNLDLMSENISLRKKYD